MSNIPSLSDVVETISSLSAGDQSWFWLSPSRVRRGPQMLISPFQSDPSMNRLVEWSHQMPNEDIPYMGFCVLGDDGVMEFAGALIDENALKITAKWVKKYSERYPKLSCLFDSRFARVNPSGIVTAVYADQSIWNGSPLSAMEEVSNHMRTAAPGQDYWCWLASIGPNLRPTMRLIPVNEDPNGKEFSSLISGLRRRCQNGGIFVHGTFRKTPEGPWVLITPEKISRWTSLKESVAYTYGDNFPVFYELLTAKLISTASSSPTTGPPSPTNETLFSDAIKILENCDKESKIMFSFGVLKGRQTPSLILGLNKSSLEKFKWSSGFPRAFGRIHYRKGLMVFQSKEDYSGFILALASWVRKAPEVERLKKLNKCRFIHRNSAGDILNRQKNDQAWKDIFKN
jgi:hypothetical protein